METDKLPQLSDLQRIIYCDRFITKVRRDLLPAASLTKQDALLQQLLRNGDWPKEWLEQRTQSENVAGWCGSVMKCMDLAMRAGRMIEALHFMQQKDSKIMSDALSDCRKFCRIEYFDFPANKKIKRIKFDLPKDLALQSEENLAKLERIHKLLEKYEAKVVETLQRNQLASQDPSHFLYWGDIELSNTSIILTGNGKIAAIIPDGKTAHLSRGHTLEPCNIIHCRFDVHNERDPITQELKSIAVDYAMQYAKVPSYGYLNLYSRPLGEPVRPIDKNFSDGKLHFSPDAWLTVRNNYGQQELLQAKDLAGWKVWQQLKHGGEKCFTLSLDGFMFASGILEGIQAVRLATNAARMAVSAELKTGMKVAAGLASELAEQQLFKASVTTTMAGLGVLHNAEGQHNSLHTVRSCYFIGDTFGWFGVSKGLSALSGTTKEARAIEVALRETLSESSQLLSGLEKFSTTGFWFLERGMIGQLGLEFLNQYQLSQHLCDPDYMEEALKRMRDGQQSFPAAKLDRDQLYKSQQRFAEAADELMKNYLRTHKVADRTTQNEIQTIFASIRRLLEPPCQPGEVEQYRSQLADHLLFSASELHDKELKRAKSVAANSWTEIVDKPVLVQSTRKELEDVARAKAALNEARKAPETKLKKANVQQKRDQLTFLEKKLAQAEKVATAQLRNLEIEQPVDRLRNKHLQQACAFAILLLTQGKHGKMPDNGVIVRRELQVKGWTKADDVKHYFDNKSGRAPGHYQWHTLPDRTVTQFLKTDDLLKILETDLKHDKSADTRISTGDALKRFGLISEARYGSTLINIIKTPIPSDASHDENVKIRADKQEALCNLSVLISILAGKEALAGKSMQRFVQMAECFNLTSTDLKRVLVETARREEEDKDIRATASYLSYLLDRDKRFWSTSDINTMQEVLGRKPPGMKFPEYLHFMKTLADFQSERLSPTYNGAALDRRMQAALALHDFCDKQTGIGPGTLYKETDINFVLALVAKSRNPLVAGKAIKQLLERADSDRTIGTRTRLYQLDLDQAEAALAVRQRLLNMLQTPVIGKNLSATSLNERAKLIELVEPALKEHPAMSNHLKSKVQEMRQQAATTLRKMLEFDPRAVETMTIQERQLNDMMATSITLRLSVVSALGELCDRKAVPALTDCLDPAKEESEEVRLATVRALDRILSRHELNDIATRALCKERSPAVAAALTRYVFHSDIGLDPRSRHYQSIAAASLNDTAARTKSAAQILEEIKSDSNRNWMLGENLAKQILQAKLSVYGEHAFLGPLWDEAGHAFPGPPTGNSARKTAQRMEDVYKLFTGQLQDLLQTARAGKNEVGMRAIETLFMVLMQPDKEFRSDPELPKRGGSNTELQLSQKMYRSLQYAAASALADACHTSDSINRKKLANYVGKALQSEYLEDRAKIQLVRGLWNLSETPLDAKSQTGFVFAPANGVETAIDALKHAIQSRCSDQYVLTLLKYIRQSADRHHFCTICSKLEGFADNATIRVKSEIEDLTADKRDRVTPLFQLAKVDRQSTKAEERAERLAGAVDEVHRHYSTYSAQRELNVARTVELIFSSCKGLPISDAVDPRIPKLRLLCQAKASVNTAASGEKAGNIDQQLDARIRLAAAWMLLQSKNETDRRLAIFTTAHVAVLGDRSGVRQDAQKLLKEFNQPRDLKVLSEALTAAKSTIESQIRSIATAEKQAGRPTRDTDPALSKTSVALQDAIVVLSNGTEQKRALIHAYARTLINVAETERRLGNNAENLLALPIQALNILRGKPLHEPLAAVANGNEAEARNTLKAQLLNTLTVDAAVRDVASALALLNDMKVRNPTNKQLPGIKYLDLAYDLLASAVGGNHPDMVEYNLRTGAIAETAKDWSSALWRYRAALHGRMREYGSTHPKVAEILERCGELGKAKALTMEKGDQLTRGYSDEFQNAERAYKQALEIRERHLNTDARALLTTKNTLADLYWLAARKTKNDGARALFIKYKQQAEKTISDGLQIAERIGNSVLVIMQLQKLHSLYKEFEDSEGQKRTGARLAELRTKPATAVDQPMLPHVVSIEGVHQLIADKAGQAGKELQTARLQKTLARLYWPTEPILAEQAINAALATFKIKTPAHQDLYEAIDIKKIILLSQKRYTEMIEVLNWQKELLENDSSVLPGSPLLMSTNIQLRDCLTHRIAKHLRDEQYAPLQKDMLLAVALDKALHGGKLSRAIEQWLERQVTALRNQAYQHIIAKDYEKALISQTSALHWQRELNGGILRESEFRLLSVLIDNVAQRTDKQLIDGVELRNARDRVRVTRVHDILSLLTQLQLERLTTLENMAKTRPSDVSLRNAIALSHKAYMQRLEQLRSIKLALSNPTLDRRGSGKP